MHKTIILVNLGSPQKLERGAIYQFLRRFLTDKRVVNLPKILWYPILFGVILPLRLTKLLAKYRLIWLDNNSPLTHYSQIQAQQLQQRYNPDETRIMHAFCYSEPTIEEALAAVKLAKCEQLVIIPLYPQQSSSTTLAVFDKLTKFYQQEYYVPRLNFISSFASHPLYIEALVMQIKKHWAKYGQAKKLICSFHSVPQQFIKNGDAYLAECEKTYALVCEKLQLRANHEVKLCFQSRFGRAKWLMPETKTTIKALALAKVSTLDVICPSFVSDCLETLEEVALNYRELFIEYGGTDLRLVSCLNDSQELTDLLFELSSKVI